MKTVASFLPYGKISLFLRSCTGSDLIILCCFFFSGFTGLLYEILWIRKSALFLGSTIQATATVLAIFFGGMAAGSFFAGKTIVRIRRLLMVYGLVELLLAATVCLQFITFPFLSFIYSDAYPIIVNHFWLLTIIRFFLLSFLLVPSTALIGATLPLIVGHFVNKNESVATVVSGLYGLNTLGGLAGAAFCGFFAITHFGMTLSLVLGVALNTIIGVVMTFMGSRKRDGECEEVQVPKSGRLSRTDKQMTMVPISDRKKIVAICFFGAGFLALGYEVLWTRYLSLIIHNTVFTYTLTLCVTLAGIAAGGITAAFFLDRAKKPFRIFSMCQICTGLMVLFVMLLPAEFWKSVIDTQQVWVQLGVASLLFFVPSFLSGISYPCAISAVSAGNKSVGRTVGFMNGINTVGGITGSIITTFVILPVLGLQSSLSVVTACGIVVGILGLFLVDNGAKRFSTWGIGFLAILAWLVIPQLFLTRIPADFLGKRGNLIDYREGLNSMLSVVRSPTGITNLEIDRLWQGQQVLSHQIMACHIPMMIHQDPQSVLVIGMGMGMVTRSFSLYPIKNLTTVDIEQELPVLIRKHFDAQWMNDPRVKLVTDDGRNFVAQTKDKYDIVSIEIGQAFRPGLAGFYTVDFYSNVKKRLNNGGIVCQFVPLSFFNIEQYRSLLKSFAEVFPKSSLWFNSYEFLIVGGSDEEVSIDAGRFSKAITAAPVYEELDYYYWGGPGFALNRFDAFIAGFLMGPAELARFTNGASAFNDDKPVLEYSSARHQNYSIQSLGEMIRVIEKHLEPPLRFVKNADKMPDEKEVEKTRISNLNNIIACEYLKYYNPDDPTTLDALQDAYKANPRNLETLYQLGIHYSSRGDIGPAIFYSKQILALNPDDIDTYRYLADVYLKTGDTQSTIKSYEDALKRAPDAAMFNTIGLLYEKVGNREAARRAFAGAFGLDSTNEAIKSNYNRTTSPKQNDAVGKGKK